MKKQLNCVLLIDDNEDDNFYHKIILHESGIARHVEIAETAYEALDFLKKTQILPELIFLDINMPRMNGWEFLDRYRKLEFDKGHQRSVIIMLTTSLNPADEKKAASIEEVSSFESKPLTHEMIQKIVDAYFPDH